MLPFARVTIIGLGLIGSSIARIAREKGVVGEIVVVDASEKHRERIVALEQQKTDIDDAIAQLQNGVTDMERRLTETRPDLLPRAADYDQVLRRQLDGAEHSEA